MLIHESGQPETETPFFPPGKESHELSWFILFKRIYGTGIRYTNYTKQLYHKTYV